MDETTVCAVAGCGRPEKSRGWCKGHYERWRLRGDVGVDRPLPERRPVTTAAQSCRIPGCDRPTGVSGAARGWCRVHYGRWHRLGDPLAGGSYRAASLEPRTRVDGPCSVEGCELPQYARRVCRSHHARLHLPGGLRPDEPFRKRMSFSTACQEQGCDRPIKARDLCGIHYGAWERAQTKSDPSKAEAWRLYNAEWKRNEYRTNTAKVRERANAWRHANPERTKLFDARKRRARRALKAAATVKFTADQLAQKISYWSGLCWMCGSPWESIDHVKPLWVGGPHMLANLRPACKSCNSSKGKKWPFPRTRREMAAA